MRLFPRSIEWGKHCFVYCGKERCNCQHSASHEQREAHAREEQKYREAEERRKQDLRDAQEETARVEASRKRYPKPRQIRVRR